MNLMKRDLYRHELIFPECKYCISGTAIWEMLLHVSVSGQPQQNGFQDNAMCIQSLQQWTTPVKHHSCIRERPTQQAHNIETMSIQHTV